jgi:hypothetical protein
MKLRVRMNRVGQASRLPNDPDSGRRSGASAFGRLGQARRLPYVEEVRV